MPPSAGTVPAERLIFFPYGFLKLVFQASSLDDGYAGLSRVVSLPSAQTKVFFVFFSLVLGFWRILKEWGIGGGAFQEFPFFPTFCAFFSFSPINSLPFPLPQRRKRPLSRNGQFCPPLSCFRWLFGFPEIPHLVTILNSRSSPLPYCPRLEPHSQFRKRLFLPVPIPPPQRLPAASRIWHSQGPVLLLSSASPLRTSPIQKVAVASLHCGRRPLSFLMTITKFLQLR